MITWIIVGCLILLFGAVVFRGAPYLPTHPQTIVAALDAMALKKGDVVVDLGAGDGSFLLAAAKRGYVAVGYELNPLLCFVAWLRSWRWRRAIRVLLRDFWLTDLPPKTQAVFVFLAGPYMQRLRRKLEQYMTTRTMPLYVVSHGFAIPGLLPQKVTHGLYIYILKPKM